MIEFVLFVLAVCFGLVVIVGAPFVPTHNSVAQHVSELVRLKKGQSFYDFGSGSGRVVAMAAKAGANAHGYELNPLLVVYSKLRLARYRNAHIHFGNYWKVDTNKVDVLFIFGMQRDVNKLHQKLLANRRPIKDVTYGFQLLERKQIVSDKGLFVYEYQPVASYGGKR